jgi:hypothetical protein
MANKYMAILISPDGEDYVTDFVGSKSVGEVWDRINDMGSKWFFYPICCVIRSVDGVRIRRNILRKRIVSAPDQLPELQGMTVKDALSYVADNHELIESILR